jgi:hypothetical protein
LPVDFIDGTSNTIVYVETLKGDGEKKPSMLHANTLRLDEKLEPRSGIPPEAKNG